MGPLFSRLSSERFFRQQFGSIFSPGHPLTDEEAEDQWALICAGAGRTLNHKTIRYMEERFRHADRWHGALTNWAKPLSLAWGMLDPVATENVLTPSWSCARRLPVTRFDDLGHYPQIEDPERVAGALRASIARLNEPLDHLFWRRYTGAPRPDRRASDGVGAGSFFAV